MIFYQAFIVSLLFNLAAGLKCYSCGGKNEKSCNEFSSTRDFEKACENAQTCMTSFDFEGGIIQKSCWSDQEDGCPAKYQQDVNDPKLCFCSRDLCNCWKSTENTLESGCETPVKQQPLTKNEAYECKYQLISIVFCTLLLKFYA